MAIITYVNAPISAVYEEKYSVVSVDLLYSHANALASVATASVATASVAKASNVVHFICFAIGLITSPLLTVSLPQSLMGNH